SALAKVDVLEPDWMEACVKTAQLLPHFAPNHKQCAGRLIGFGGPGKIEVQTAVTAVHRVERHYAINAENLEHQSHWHRKAAQSKTRLNAPVGVHEPSAGERGPFRCARAFKRIDACCERDIRI